MGAARQGCCTVRQRALPARGEPAGGGRPCRSRRGGALRRMPPSHARRAPAAAAGGATCSCRSAWRACLPGGPTCPLRACTPVTSRVVRWADIFFDVKDMQAGIGISTGACARPVPAGAVAPRGVARACMGAPHAGRPLCRWVCEAGPLLGPASSFLASHSGHDGSFPGPPAQRARCPLAPMRFPRRTPLWLPRPPPPSELGGGELNGLADGGAPAA